jgi:type III secretion system FlhB-like substrate exporter
MAKKPSNKGKPWTSRDVSELETLAKQNMPPRVIALTMGRTLEAIYRKAKQHGISLKSTDQLRCRTKRS